MGYTEEDAKADMHDIELMELSPENEEAFAQAFGSSAAKANNRDRFGFLAWLVKHLDEAEALNKSASRVTICVAMAGLPNYETNDERDGPLGLPTGTDMLEAIMPPATDDTWGSYGRPTSFFHQITRMGGTVKSGKSKGKPMHLVKTLLGPEGQFKMGRLVIGQKLDSTGMVYGHLHGNGKVTKNDLFDYWTHVAHGREMPDATNPAYLALIGKGPVVDESPNQWSTPGAYAWGLLDHLERNDTTVPERYKTVSANRLSTILTAVYTKDAVKCMKFLDNNDQRLLIDDVMVHAKVGTNKFARSKVHKDINAARTYKAKIELLAMIYASEHEQGPDATTVIDELICRCAWAVVTRVMGHRTGRSFGHVVDAAEELMNHARTLEQLEALQETVGDLSARITTGPDDYEPDEDMVGRRAMER